jgi:hypothetical protein
LILTVDLVLKCLLIPLARESIVSRLDCKFETPRAQASCLPASRIQCKAQPFLERLSPAGCFLSLLLGGAMLMAIASALHFPLTRFA